MVPFLVTNYVEYFFLGNVDHSFVSFVKCLIGLQSCFLVTFIGVWLIYNVVLVSGVQQSESVVRIHAFILF